jgi:hypothetical protein
MMVIRMTEEIWKPVFCGENEYKISSNGRIWSCISKRIMKQHTEHCGYSVIKLSGGHGHGKNFFIHKLVAEAFLPNPKHLPEVNHRDENKANNRVDNLEWCTHKYNQNYGTLKQRISAKNRNGIGSKPVLQYSIDGKFMAEFPSMGEIERKLGFKSCEISLCCLGKKPQYMGYLWRYKSGNESPAKIDGYLKYRGSGAPKSNSVIKYDLHGNKVGEYLSIESAGKKCHLASASISLCCRGKAKSCGGFIWRFKNDAVGDKIKDIERSKLFSPVAKCGMSGKIIREFVSISEAVKATGVSSSNISDCCNGRAKTAGGCKWKFV